MVAKQPVLHEYVGCISRIEKGLPKVSERHLFIRPDCKAKNKFAFVRDVLAASLSRRWAPARSKGRPYHAVRHLLLLLLTEDKELYQKKNIRLGTRQRE